MSKTNQYDQEDIYIYIYIYILCVSGLGGRLVVSSIYKIIKVHLCQKNL